MNRDAIRRAIAEAARQRIDPEEFVRQFEHAATVHAVRRLGEAMAWWWNGAHRWPCSSPRRNQCRTGTARPGRDYDPARWPCTGPGGRELFLGPLMWSPINDVVWYEPRERPR